MFRMKHNKPIFNYLTLLLVIMFVFAGCSAFSQKKEDTASQPSVEQAEEDAPLYYDFGDVPVPSELKLVTKSLRNGSDPVAPTALTPGSAESRSTSWPKNVTLW